jgi:hypothetical protein
MSGDGVPKEKPGFCYLPGLSFSTFICGRTHLSGHLHDRCSIDSTFEQGAQFLKIPPLTGGGRTGKGDR